METPGTRLARAQRSLQEISAHRNDALAAVARFTLPAVTQPQQPRTPNTVEKRVDNSFIYNDSFSTTTPRRHVPSRLSSSTSNTIQSSSPDVAPFFPQDVFSRAASALETTAAAIVSTSSAVAATPPRVANSQQTLQKQSPSSYAPPPPSSSSKESLADLLANIEIERRKREQAENMAAHLRSELAAKLAHEKEINQDHLAGPRAPPSLGSSLRHPHSPQHQNHHHHHHHNELNREQSSRSMHSPQRHPIYPPSPPPPPPPSQIMRPQSPPPKSRSNSPDSRASSAEITALKHEVQRLKAQLEAESSGASIMMQRREAASKEKELKLESQLAAMSRQLSKAQAEVASSMSLAEERLARLNNNSQRLAAARSDAEAADLSLRTARTDHVATEALLRKTEAELKATIEKNDVQRSQIDDLSAEILRLNLKNEETTRRQREGSISVASTMASVADEKKMNSQDVKMLELEVEVSRLRASNSALHNSLREVDSHIERVSTALQQSELKCSAAKKEAAEAQASKARAVAELTARASFAEQDGLGMRNRFESALNQVAEAEARAAAFSDRIGGLEDELRASKQLISQLRSDLSSRSAECDAFGEQVRLQATENEALRSHLPSSMSSSSSSSSSSSLMITESAESYHNDLMNAQRILPRSAVSFSNEEYFSSLLPSSSSPEPSPYDDHMHASLVVVGKVSPGSLASIAPHKSLGTSPPTSTALSATSIGSSSLPSSSTKTNHRRVYAALSSVLFAGPSFADKLMSAKRALEEHADRQVVIALVTTGSRSAGQFAGLYSVLDDHESGLESALNSGTVDAAAGTNLRLATRIFGTNNAGPSTILAKMVLALFKFDTSTKTFAEVGSQANQLITPSVDAIGIDVGWKESTKK